MLRLSRRLLVAPVILALAACGSDKDLTEPTVALGEFKLGHNIVVAKNVQKVEPSKNATPEEWEVAMKAAVDRRFSRFKGCQFYHIAISVDGYSIAIPGVPLVLSPKSVLIVSANVWDDAAQKRLNAEPEQITILESFDGESVIGSGLTKSKEEQIQDLSQNAVRQVERWMRENEQWFTRRPDIDPESCS